MFAHIIAKTSLYTYAENVTIKMIDAVARGWYHHKSEIMLKDGIKALNHGQSGCGSNARRGKR